MNIILLSVLCESRGCLRTAEKKKEKGEKNSKPSHHCYSCLQGGLAAEKFGEFAAWGPGRRHPDSEETPAEHTHLNPSAAQEHAMEAVGSASMRTKLALILRSSFLCASVCVRKCTYIYVFISRLYLLAIIDTHDVQGHNVEYLSSKT